MRFTKMEGIGNDYIYINGLEETVADPAALSVRMSRPHFGCGSDGLILILPSSQADFRMQMFNNDGSESAPIMLTAENARFKETVDTSVVPDVTGKIKATLVVTVDGKDYDGCLIPFEDGKKEYHVTVHMG